MKTIQTSILILAACLLTVAAFAEETAIISIKTDSQSYPVHKTVFACDGNKANFWHTEFGKNNPAPPRFRRNPTTPTGFYTWNEGGKTHSDI